MTDPVLVINIKKMNIVVSVSTDHSVEYIKNILSLNDKDIKKLAKDIYKLSVPYTEKNEDSVISKITTFGDVSRALRDSLILMKDFKNSKVFYKEANEKMDSGKGFKVISDDFSNERGKYLFPAFQSIETRWRKLVAIRFIDAGYGYKSIPNPNNYRNTLPDHKLSMYELSKLIEYLVSVSNKDGKNTSKVDLDMAKLLKIDELSFPLDRDELEIIRKVRNQCMHFKVLTPDDYKKVVPLINSYMLTQILNDFTMPCMNAITKLVKPNMALINQFISNFEIY